jgi:hypothetical protein
VIFDPKYVETFLDCGVNEHFKVGKARHRWLMSVILTTQEAQRLGGLWFEASPWQLIPGDPILKIPNTKKGWWSGSRCRP